MCGEDPYVHDSNLDAPIACEWRDGNLDAYFRAIGTTDNVEILNFHSLVYIVVDRARRLEQAFFVKTGATNYALMRCDDVDFAASVRINQIDRTFELNIIDLRDEETNPKDRVSMPHMKKTTIPFYPLTSVHSRVILTSIDNHADGDNALFDALRLHDYFFVDLEGDGHIMNITIPSNDKNVFKFHYHP